MRVLTIIPARGGSKGIYRKNLAMCAGKPLLQWAIEAAQASRLASEYIMVSSDDEEIREFARDMGTKAHERSQLIAQDQTSIDSVVGEILNVLRWPTHIVVLQPTSPLRTAEHIDGAMEQLIRTDSDSVVSVVSSHTYTWLGNHPLFPQKRINRQAMEGYYQENGAVYGFTMESWLKNHLRVAGDVTLYEMPEETKFEVDNQFDLLICNMLLQEKTIRVAA